MAQRFLRFFGQSKTQKAVYEALSKFLKDLESTSFNEIRNLAIKKFKDIALENISKKEEIDRFEHNKLIKFNEFSKKNEKSKENSEEQNRRNHWYKKWGSNCKGLSTYNFLKKFCGILEKSLDQEENKTLDLKDVENLKRKLSKSAAINTRRSLKLIDEIVEQIRNMTTNDDIIFNCNLFGLENEKKELQLKSGDEINEDFFTKKLKYSKEKCSGIKIMHGKNLIAEIKNKGFNKPCKEIFKNSKTYNIYYSVKCLVTINEKCFVTTNEKCFVTTNDCRALVAINKKSKEIKTGEIYFYTNECCEKIYKKLQKKTGFQEKESELWINDKKTDKERFLFNYIENNKLTKISIENKSEKLAQLALDFFNASAESIDLKVEEFESLLKNTDKTPEDLLEYWEKNLEKIKYPISSKKKFSEIFKKLHKEVKTLVLERGECIENTRWQYLIARLKTKSDELLRDRTTLLFD